MDVAVRRSIWDIICNIRRWGTAVILTSHSMEECEALCTRLMIMVNGQIKCIGSLQELKSRYGAGYNVQVRVKLDEDGNPDSTALCGFMRLNFPDATVEGHYQQQLNYIIPKQSHETFSKIFSLLEENKELAKIQDYTVSQTTLEQVFLSFARAQKHNE